MRHSKLLIAICAATALTSAGALTAAAGALGSQAHAGAASTVVSTKKTSLGTILVTSSGQTLYADSGDRPPHFACTGGCLTAWPPLKDTGTIKAAGGAVAGDLGKVKGPAGEQVTYRGHPLYTFASDSSGNPTSGEGVNGFYVVSPSGTMITKSTQTPASSAPAPGW